MPNPPTDPPATCDRVALCLQGGGALGSYQAGVFEALAERGLDPGWIAGVSIGAINAALIAGNPPERRVERLRAFWERVTTREGWGLSTPPWPLSWMLAGPGGDDLRRAKNVGSALGTLALGQPGFFKPRFGAPWLSPDGSPGATSFYDTAPLRATLEELIDWDLLNIGPERGGIRVAVGAVNVETGNFRYFDNAHERLGAEHVMASGALPPGLPMVRVGEEGWFWDGGLVSNTPLQHLLEEETGCRDALVFQVDLFPARGKLPHDLDGVLGRKKDIQYSSRTRLNTDAFMRRRGWELRLKRALSALPEDALDAEQRRLREQLTRLPRYTLLQLIYRSPAYEGEAKDYEFGPETMREHWASGLAAARRTLERREWMALPPEDPGIVSHDIDRPEGGGKQTKLMAAPERLAQAAGVPPAAAAE